MASKALEKIEAALPTAPQNRQLDALRLIAEQTTPKEEIRWRPGRGGARLPYTDTAYVIRALNQAFGWDWDFVADNEELLLNGARPFEVKVRGTLIVRLGGQSVTKTQFGCQPIEMLKDGSAPVSIGDCYKGAASDALKKCASLLGIALDLYDSDSPVHGGREHQQSGERQQRQGPAQPSQPTAGKAGQIRALASALKWDDAKLINEIFARFNIALESIGAIETLDGGQQAELIQALKAELSARAQTTSK